MNILDLIMNKPLEDLTVKDLQRLHRAGYIQVSELVDLKNVDPNASYDIVVFMLRYSSKYEVGSIDMSYINYAYGASLYKNELEAIADCKSLIVKGIKTLAENKQVCLNELITKLQQDYK